MSNALMFTLFQMSGLSEGPQKRPLSVYEHSQLLCCPLSVHEHSLWLCWSLSAVGSVKAHLKDEPSSDRMIRRALW